MDPKKHVGARVAAMAQAGAAQALATHGVAYVILCSQILHLAVDGGWRWWRMEEARWSRRPELFYIAFRSALTCRLSPVRHFPAFQFGPQRRMHPSRQWRRSFTGIIAFQSPASRDLFPWWTFRRAMKCLISSRSLPVGIIHHCLLPWTLRPLPGLLAR